MEEVTRMNVEVITVAEGWKMCSAAYREFYRNGFLVGAILDRWAFGAFAKSERARWQVFRYDCYPVYYKSLERAQRVIEALMIEAVKLPGGK